MISKDPTSEKILKPILRGRDIARYRANWAELWLIDTHNGYAHVPPLDVDDYPAIKAHLDRFIHHLRRRQDKGVTPYNLRNCAYHDHFDREKLFWKDMAETGAFAYSDTSIFANDKAFMLTGNDLKYLCAVLNSTIVSWLVSKSGLTTGMGLTQWKKYVVEAIPVPLPDAHTLRAINEAMVNLLTVYDGGDSDAVQELDESIDRMVFGMYGLTAHEIDTLKRRESV